MLKMEKVLSWSMRTLHRVCYTPDCPDHSLYDGLSLVGAIHLHCCFTAPFHHPGPKIAALFAQALSG